MVAVTTFGSNANATTQESWVEKRQAESTTVHIMQESDNIIKVGSRE